MKPFANIVLGAAGVIGSLTLPEMAATAAGFGTCAWMLVQIALAIRKYQRSGCSRTNCPSRTEG